MQQTDRNRCTVLQQPTHARARLHSYDSSRIAIGSVVQVNGKRVEHVELDYCYCLVQPNEINRKTKPDHYCVRLTMLSGLHVIEVIPEKQQGTSLTRADSCLVNLCLPPLRLFSRRVLAHRRRSYYWDE